MPLDLDVDQLADLLAAAILASQGPILARLAALEAIRAVPGRDGRDGAPGAPGTPGRDGTDGAPGTHGADGLGYDDLTVLYDGERSFTFRFARGAVTKEFPFVVPVDLYRGVWLEGRTYERGDGVTWAGSEWHCHEPTTTKPGDGSKSWTLKVKRGRDGKDAR